MAFILGGSPHFRSLLGYPQEGGQRQRDGWCWWRWRRRGLPPSHWEHFRARLCLPCHTGSTSGLAVPPPSHWEHFRAGLCLPCHTGSTSVLAVPPSSHWEHFRAGCASPSDWGLSSAGRGGGCASPIRLPEASCSRSSSFLLSLPFSPSVSFSSLSASSLWEPLPAVLSEGQRWACGGPAVCLARASAACVHGKARRWAPAVLSRASPSLHPAQPFWGQREPHSLWMKSAQELCRLGAPCPAPRSLFHLLGHTRTSPVPPVSCWLWPWSRASCPQPAGDCLPGGAAQSASRACVRGEETVVSFRGGAAWLLAWKHARPLKTPPLRARGSFKRSSRGHSVSGSRCQGQAALRP